MVYLAKWIRLLATGCVIGLPLAAACGTLTSESSLPRSVEPGPASWIPYRTGADDVLVKIEETGGSPLPWFRKDFILYGDGTLVYWVEGNNLLRGQLDETAIQEVLRRAVYKARFFASREFYDTAVVDARPARITVNTEAQCGSTQFYRPDLYGSARGITSGDRAQVRRLTELKQWLRSLDQRQADSPGWVDLGEFIPGVISLMVSGPYSQGVSSDVEAWPFLDDIDLVSLTATTSIVAVKLDGDRARQVHRFLTDSSSSNGSVLMPDVFSQGESVFGVNYRPWPGDSCR